MSDFTPISGNIRILNNSEKTNRPTKNTDNPTGAVIPITTEIKDIYQPEKVDRVGNVNTSSSMLYNGILKQIKDQTLEMLRTGIPGAVNTEYREKTLDNLVEYFENDREAIKEVQKGEVPEYWNVENTGKRIFDIALAGYEEGKDRIEFYERAKALISGAYADVQKMMSFDFPELVQDTRNAIFDALEQFLNGTDINELSFEIPKEES